MLEPLKKTRLYEEIVKQFIEKIRKGELKPGDRLPTERDLAIMLNVSRTSIREALRSMELIGIIDSKVGGGTYIREMTLDNVMESFASVFTKNDRLIMELLEIRMLLESYSARMAARKINEEKIKKIKASLDLMEDEISRGDLGFAGDNAFHNELASAAENLALSSILALCEELISSSRKAALEALDTTKIGLEEHKQIFEAIKMGNEEEAARFMNEHLIRAHYNIEKKIKSVRQAETL